MMQSEQSLEYMMYINNNEKIFLDVAHLLENDKHYEKIYKNLYNKTNLIFSVGCGIGTFELSLAQSGCELSFCEPSHFYYQSMLDKIEKQNLSSLFKERYNDLFENINTEYRYGYVLFNHSWYPFFNNSMMLSKSLNMLDSSGEIIFILNTKEGFINELKNLVSNASLDLHSQILNGSLNCRFNFEVSRHMIPTANLILEGKVTSKFKSLIRFLNPCLSIEEIDAILKEDEIWSLVSSFSIQDKLAIDYGITKILK